MFRHALVRDVVYADLLPGERRDCTGSGRGACRRSSAQTAMRQHSPSRRTTGGRGSGGPRRSSGDPSRRRGSADQRIPRSRRAVRTRSGDVVPIPDPRHTQVAVVTRCRPGCRGEPMGRSRRPGPGIVRAAIDRRTSRRRAVTRLGCWNAPADTSGRWATRDRPALLRASRPGRSREADPPNCSRPCSRPEPRDSSSWGASATRLSPARVRSGRAAGLNQRSERTCWRPRASAWAMTGRLSAGLTALHEAKDIAERSGGCRGADQGVLEPVLGARPGRPLA